MSDIVVSIAFFGSIVVVVTVITVSATLGNSSLNRQKRLCYEAYCKALSAGGSPAPPIWGTQASGDEEDGGDDDEEHVD